MGAPRNWVKQGIKIGWVTVEKIGDKLVVIRTGTIKGLRLMLYWLKAGQVISQVKSVLENNFGLVLRNRCVLVSSAVFRFYNEVARELNKYGAVKVGMLEAWINLPLRKFISWIIWE